MSEPPAANGRTDAEPDGFGDLADHGRFVRNLAWRLLHDEDAAEEVVQETMLAVVKASPKRDRSLRPWLATVARNVIRKRFRGESRRRRREEVAAQPEALPGTADMAARAEMLKVVVDAVLSLDEPNRSTVLLRFYEDLPPREIAARQGVGVETVRGRLKRAVLQLRRRLDALHPEGRSGWVPLLAGLCGMDASASILGGSGGAATGAEAAAAQAPGTVAGGLKGVAAAFLLGGALTGAAAWWGIEPAGPGATGDAVTRSGAASAAADPARASSATGREAATLVGHSSAAERLAAARTRNADLRERVAALGRKVAAAQPAPPDPHAFHFALPAESPAFDAADWKDLAGHLLELSKILDTLREEVVTLREPRAQTTAVLLEHNQPLSLFAISILDEMGVGSPSAAYTHPSVLANLIRAALDLAGRPLSHAQEVSIRTLGEAWQAEAAELDRTPAAGVPVLAGTIAEVDAKLRFVRAVKDLLTDGQRAALFHPQTEERVQVDLLSAALVHNALRSPVDANDRAELERALVASLFSLAGLEDEDPAPYAWIGKRWVDEIPEVLEPRYPWQLDVVFTHVDALQAQARAQVRAIEGIVGTGLLDDAEAEALLRVEILLRPRIRRNLPEPDAPDGD